MSIADYELLKELGLNQAELGRIIQRSRQAVNAGMRGDDNYLHAAEIQRVHLSFVSAGDFRQNITAKILLNKFGVKPDYSAGALDVLGLNLNEDRVRLILGNRSLRDYLRKVVFEIVETKCREFESIFSENKTPE